MKNILLLFSFLLFAGVGFSQIKVVTNGDTKIGQTNIANITGTKLDVHGALFVRGTSTLPNTGFIINNSNSLGPWFGAHTDANGNSSANYIASRFRPGAAGVFIETSPATAAGAARVWTPRLFVSPIGKVGIGTTSPLGPAGSLTVQGNIYHQGTLIYSDKRLKNNVVEYKGGLEAIMGLNTITYKYNGKAGRDSSKKHLGIFAQDLQKVAPGLVSEVEVANYEDDITGRKKVSSEKYLAIHDNEIKYLLIDAVKEQQQIIEDQNERLNNLEEIVNKLANNDFENVIDVNLSESTALLEQNVPNPFDERTSIGYSVPGDFSSAQLKIFNMSGQLIKNVNIDRAGKGTINLNSLNLGSGQYSYSLIVDGSIIGSKKMVLTK